MSRAKRASFFEKRPWARCWICGIQGRHAKVFGTELCEDCEADCLHFGVQQKLLRQTADRDFVEEFWNQLELPFD